MNTENIKKPYRSCYRLESGIVFTSDDIVFCCDWPSPAHIQPMADAGKTVDAFLEARDRVIRENQGMSPPCEGCWQFQEYEPTNGEIKQINFSIHNFCNFSCTYCFAECTQDKDRSEYYDPFPILEEFKRRGLLSKALEVDCASGEITVNPFRDKYYDYIEENASLVFFVSNAGRFDPRLAHILSLSPKSGMTVSIDSGTEETFRRVRGVNMFKQVIANLAEYRKYSSYISLKYILLDENCGDEDLNGFIQICGELKPSQMIISADCRKMSQLGYEEHIVSAAVKLAEGAIRLNIDFIFFDYLGQANLQEICRRVAALPEVASAEHQLDTILSASKVVCYGAGGNCENVLSQIKTLGLRKPDVIWDIKAEPGQKFHTVGYEYPVCCPDFEQLNDSMDIGVFTTIASSATNQQLAQDMKNHGFSNLLTYDRLVLALIAKRAKTSI